MRPKPRLPSRAYVLGETWVEAEEFAYPNGGETRRARALFPDGQFRIAMVGIPDTFFTIPGHATVRGKRIRGYVTIEQDIFVFVPNRR